MHVSVVTAVASLMDSDPADSRPIGMPLPWVHSWWGLRQREQLDATQRLDLVKALLYVVARAWSDG